MDDELIRAYKVIIESQASTLTALTAIIEAQQEVIRSQANQ